MGAWAPGRAFEIVPRFIARYSDLVSVESIITAIPTGSTVTESSERSRQRKRSVDVSVSPDRLDRAAGGRPAVSSAFGDCSGRLAWVAPRNCNTSSV